MGGNPTKLSNPKGNVINNVEIVDHTSQIDSVWSLMLVSVVLQALSLLIKLYQLHKRSLRKKYESRATELDKI